MRKKKNIHQIWQLEQGNSIVWHKEKLFFPSGFWEGAKQMCSNIYKGTIFTCFSDADPVDLQKVSFNLVPSKYDNTQVPYYKLKNSECLQIATIPIEQIHGD